MCIPRLYCSIQLTGNLSSGNSLVPFWPHKGGFTVLLWLHNSYYGIRQMYCVIKIKTGKHVCIQEHNTNAKIEIEPRDWYLDLMNTSGKTPSQSWANIYKCKRMYHEWKWSYRQSVLWFYDISLWVASNLSSNNRFLQQQISRIHPPIDCGVILSPMFVELCANSNWFSGPLGWMSKLTDSI